MFNEWKKAAVLKKSVFEMYPSMMYLAGTRNGVTVVKVFLTSDGKKGTLDKFREQFSDAQFEFVDVATEFEQNSNNMKKIENLEQSAPDIDKDSRIKMKDIISRHAAKIFANHSSIMGFDISNVRSENNEMLNEFCIVLFCLDDSILPFGESPLPKSLEGYPCDVRKGFCMFGDCLNCQGLNVGCSIGIPSENSAGSVGFFVKANNFPALEQQGFITAAHVAIKNYDELYEQSLLLSESFANASNEIVHPSYADSTANVVIGKVIKSFFGNLTNGTGVDAAFVETNQPKLGGMHIYFFLILKSDTCLHDPFKAYDYAFIKRNR